MHHTNKVLEPDGSETKVLGVCCGACGNNWYVIAAPEFQPSYCCYCGIKYTCYTDVDDVKRYISGQEM